MIFLIAMMTYKIIEIISITQITVQTVTPCAAQQHGDYANALGGRQ
jgi:hypothetical protein